MKGGCQKRRINNLKLFSLKCQEIIGIEVNRTNKVDKKEVGVAN